MKISDSPHKRFTYPNYPNLIYCILFNKTAKQLEQEYRVKPRENLRDYFTGQEKYFLVNQSKMLILKK